mgnify:CR=1 FL=1
MVFQPTGSYIAKVFKLWLFSYTLLFLTKVTIKLVRCIALRTLAFRGEEAEPPRRFAPAGLNAPSSGPFQPRSQPFLYLPQDTEWLPRVGPRTRKCAVHFRGVKCPPLHSTNTIQSKATIFKKTT